MFSIIFSIFLGIIGLGIIVFIHELGHFLAARAMGVEVEAFAIGWGKTIFTIHGRKTEYRLAIFPLGGYCKMKGENYLVSAIENPKEAPVPEPGSFYAAAPWRRIIIAVMGPFFNLLFAFIAFSFVALSAPPFQSPVNKVLLQSHFGEKKELYPADRAGLKDGDVILSIDNKPVESYMDIMEIISTADHPQLSMQVQNKEGFRTVELTPVKEKNTLVHGILPWIDTKIKAITEKSPAEVAGLKSGDTILSMNGRETPHKNAIDLVLRARPESIKIVYERDSKKLTTLLVPDLTDKVARLGIEFEIPKFRKKAPNVAEAFQIGYHRTEYLMSQMLIGLGSLFTGANFFEAISGPLRNTYYVGEVATRSFAESFGEGVGSVVNFLSLLSVALFVMNLLPLPALDGGLILINFVEMIIRRPLKPIILIRYQQLGVILIIALVILSTVSDISFFSKMK